MLLFSVLLYACALMLGSLLAVAVAYLTYLFGSDLKLANAKFWGGFPGRRPYGFNAQHVQHSRHCKA